MIQDLYIHGGKAYTDSQFTQEAAKTGLRLSYGDECVVTLHFDLGVLAEGDTVMAAFDADMLFGQKGTSPMGKAQKEVTAAEAQTQEITLSLPTNTERFYDVVNGQRVAVPVYFGIYTFEAGGEEGYPQVSAALFPVLALPVVALLSDTVVPVEPKDLYYTKQEVDTNFVANSQKGAANGVATLDGTGKVPREQIPEGGTIVIDNALSTTSTNPVQNKVITLAMQSKANLVNGKVPASEIPSLNYIPNAEKGIANGVATLDNQGKVPNAQLPTMDYVPNAEKGVANGVASLDANGKVPDSQLDIMKPIIGTTAPTTSTVGAVGQLYVNTTTSKTYHCTAVTNTGTESEPVYSYTWTDDVNAMGGDFATSPSGQYVHIDKGSMFIGNANAKSIGVGSLSVGYNNSCGYYSLCAGQFVSMPSARQFGFGYGITLGNDDILGVGGNDYSNSPHLFFNRSGNLYITGGHQQHITTIPAATTAYTPAEGVYSHIPEAATTYTLPAVSDTTKTHEIILNVRFSAATISIAFEDSDSTTIVPLSTPTISAGSVVSYLCRFEPLLEQWAIMPVELGTYTEPEEEEEEP